MRATAWGSPAPSARALGLLGRVSQARRAQRVAPCSGAPAEAAGSTILAARRRRSGICLTAAFGGLRRDDLASGFSTSSTATPADAGPAVARRDLAAFRARDRLRAGPRRHRRATRALERRRSSSSRSESATLPSTPGFLERVVVADGSRATSREVERARARWRRRRRFGDAPVPRELARGCGRSRSAGAATRERALAVVDEARALAEPDDVADQIPLDLSEALRAGARRTTASRRGPLDRAGRGRGRETRHGVPGLHHRVRRGERRSWRWATSTARDGSSPASPSGTRRAGSVAIAERYRRDLAGLDGSP